MSQVAGGHTQEMAGIQGGTIGCHSIKTNPEFVLDRADKKVINGIINQKSSHFNSKIKTVEKPETVISAFEESFDKAQKASKAQAQSEISRPRSETIDIAKAQAVEVGKELKKTRSRSSSVPPPISRNKEKGGHSF